MASITSGRLATRARSITSAFRGNASRKHPLPRLAGALKSRKAAHTEEERKSPVGPGRVEQPDEASRSASESPRSRRASSASRRSSLAAAVIVTLRPQGRAVAKTSRAASAVSVSR